MTKNCDHCGKPLGNSVVYDHGQRFHPLCFEPAFGKKQAEKEKPVKKDWSIGKYET